MMHRFVICLIMGLGLTGLGGGCGKDRTQAEGLTEAVPVRLEGVIRREVSIPVRVSGSLGPKSQMKLAFKTGGFIAAIHAEEGDAIRKGQVLATLNLSEVQARVSQARNGLEKAKRDLVRVKNLYEDRAATLEQMQNATTAFELARSNVEIAEFNLKHSRITAPVDGRILKRLMETNEMVGPGSPVFVFGATGDSWVVSVGVSARDAVRLRIGDRAEVEFDAYPGKVFSGRVSERAAALDPRSGTFEVEVAVDPAGTGLMSGFVARAAIYPGETENLVLVPIEALVDSEGQLAHVYVVEGDRAVKRRVTVVHLLEDRAAVRADFTGRERVVTDGAGYLHDGAEVRIVR